LLSRRDILIGAGVAGAAALARPVASAFATASQPSTPIHFRVPAGACDCHTHIFGDPRRFPFAAARPYTPETASVAEMQSLHRALHIDRVVIGQPTVYGTDHSCALDAIQQIGPGARGIAVLGENTSDAEIDRLHRGGFRGVILHKASSLQAAADRIKGRGWHVELYVQLAEIEHIKEHVIASPVPVVLTIFGGAQASLGLQQPGFDTLLSLLHGGKVYIDLSPPFRVSKQAPDFPDIAPIAKALIAANPKRMTWGTDWPHTAAKPGQQMTGITPMEPIDDGHSLNLLATWTSGADQLKLILVDNPARLYGF